MTQIASLVVLFSLAACGAGPDDGVGFLAPEVPALGVQVKIPKFEMPAFSEKEGCVFLKTPNPEAGKVIRIELKARLGLHHAFISKTTVDLVDGEVECFGFPDEVMEGLAIPEPLFASSTQVTEETVTFPDGVGVDLAPEQQLVFNYHYINVTEQEIDAEVFLNLHFAEPTAAIEPAVVYVFGNIGGVDVPAQSDATLTTFCNFPEDTNLISVTPHMHALGTRFEIRDHDGTNPGDLILETDGWDNPSTTYFSPTLSKDAGTGLQFTCEWSNPTDKDVAFGQTSADEMCFVFGYVYPASKAILELDIVGDNCTTVPNP